MMSAIDIVFWLDFASTVISLLSGIFGAISFAKWFPQEWEAVDEYGGGYWLPAAWFTGENFETVVNPIFWMPLPAPPTPKGGA